MKERLDFDIGVQWQINHGVLVQAHVTFQTTTVQVDVSETREVIIWNAEPICTMLEIER